LDIFPIYEQCFTSLVRVRPDAVQWHQGGVMQRPFSTRTETNPRSTCRCGALSMKIWKPDSAGLCRLICRSVALFTRKKRLISMTHIKPCKMLFQFARIGHCDSPLCLHGWWLNDALSALSSGVWNHREPGEEVHHVWCTSFMFDL
jgi:hypothetical protein